MVVTEFALLPLKSRGALPAELAALLEEAQKTQDAWVRARENPAQPETTREARGTAMFQQLEDPSVLLITTQWPSPDGHKEWIASPENTATMKTLAPFLDTAGERHVTLFHLDAEALTDLAEGQTTVLKAPVISVGRFTAREDAREAFQQAFDAARWIVEDVSRPYPLRGGWRIERKRDTDEFVTFCGWTSVEQHMSAMQHKEWDTWKAAQQHISTADIRHYKRVV